MKKVLTFSLAIMLVSCVFAQSGQWGQRDYSYNNNNGYGHPGMNNKNPVFNGPYNNNNNNNRPVYDQMDNNRFGDRRYSDTRELQEKIESINREYDYRIMRVRDIFFMSRFQKEQKICMLEEQRKAEICQVKDRFNSRENYSRRGDHYERHNW